LRGEYFLTETPLVFIELRGGAPTRGSLGLLSKAREIFGTAAAVLCSAEWSSHTAVLASSGATHVYYCDEVRANAEPEALLLNALSTLFLEQGFSTVLFADSGLASELAGGLSALLEAGVNWRLEELTVVDGALRGTRRSRVVGQTIQLEWSTPRKIAVVRSSNLPLARFDSDPELISFEATPPTHSEPRFVISLQPRDSVGLELRAADIIVAGGRGMHDESSLRFLERLAELLGGAVGVSMPIVDRGWYPYANQIGSASEAVSPRLYIACGISGSVQHLAGMRNSQFIVAINTDASAPIMTLSDIGVVGDLHKVVPRLSELVARHQASGIRSSTPVLHHPREGAQQ
jgi:electron transfer flavoprotein alpha subunit